MCRLLRSFPVSAWMETACGRSAGKTLPIVPHDAEGIHLETVVAGGGCRKTDPPQTLPLVLPEDDPRIAHDPHLPVLDRETPVSSRLCPDDF